MHFHDSFIAHFFPVLSLSCCHKQTSAVLLLFIIHKSNKVASQDGSRRHSRGVLHHSFSYYVLCPYPFRPLSRGSILQPPPVFSCLPACLLSVRIRENGSDDAARPLLAPALVEIFTRVSSLRRERKSNVTVIFVFFHRRRRRATTKDTRDATR